MPRSQLVVDVVQDSPIRSYAIAQKAQPAAMENIKAQLPTASQTL